MIRFCIEMTRVTDMYALASNLKKQKAQNSTIPLHVCMGTPPVFLNWPSGTKAKGKARSRNMNTRKLTQGVG